MYKFYKRRKLTLQMNTLTEKEKHDNVQVGVKTTFKQSPDNTEQQRLHYINHYIIANSIMFQFLRCYWYTYTFKWDTYVSEITLVIWYDNILSITQLIIHPVTNSLKKYIEKAPNVVIR